MERQIGQDTNGYGALQYPVFRTLCPELTDDQYEGMRCVVLGWMFGQEVAQA